MKYIHLLIISITFLSGCGPSIVKPISQDTQSVAQDVSPSSTLPKTSSLTPSFSNTPAATSSPSQATTNTPIATSTPFPIPSGVIARKDMQQRIEEWVTGNTPFSDKKRFVDDKTGEVLRLGLLSKEPLNMVIFLFYNLGFTIIQDQQGNPYILNIVGFEDSIGQRFSFPFHIGKLFSQDDTLILRKFNGRPLVEGKQLSYSRLTPLLFIQNERDLVLNTNLGVTYIGASGRPEIGVDYFMETSKETTEALSNFLSCNCIIEDAPSTLKIFMNIVPEEFDQTLPYLWIYTVSHW